MINKLIYLLFISSLLFAQDDQEEWLKKQEESINAFIEEQNSYIATVTKEFDDFVAEQEQLFEDFKKEVDKKWKNIGSLWHIDHIIPLKYKENGVKPSLEEQIKRLHYTNTQPLYATENIKKGNRYIG